MTQRKQKFERNFVVPRERHLIDHNVDTETRRKLFCLRNTLWQRERQAAKGKGAQPKELTTKYSTVNIAKR